jgi:hypothetical protein
MTPPHTTIVPEVVIGILFVYAQGKLCFISSHSVFLVKV